MAMTLRKRAPRPQEPADPSPVKKRRLQRRGRKPRAQSANYRRGGRRGRWGSSDGEVASSSYSSSEEEAEEEEVPEYEKIREQRMRENKEKMEKLGIFSLSQHFNKKKPARRVPSKKKPSITRSFAAPYERARRSTRMKEPGCYFKDEGTLESMGISVPESWAPEVYTEEHEKLLGNCEKPWTLYVDGYGEDGERLYDPLNGKMCHQCRQKTVGHLSLCRKCKSAQGQLCGDCLCMRYGENVLEANENLNWSCPSCRGICNCSRCRRAKGWAPTVCLYQKVIGLGYRSVAHYLIQSRNAMNKPYDKAVAVAGAGANVNPDVSPQSAPQVVVDLDTSDGDFSAVELDAYDSDSSQEAYEPQKREPSVDVATDDENEHVKAEALGENHLDEYIPREPGPSVELVKGEALEDNSLEAYEPQEPEPSAAVVAGGENEKGGAVEEKIPDKYESEERETCIEVRVDNENGEALENGPEIKVSPDDKHA